jgi:hypothetical protein
MGTFFTDKFSLLHLASGIIAYYWGVSFVVWNLLHIAYEIAENTATGMALINKITIWPGGKDEADSTVNSIGDQFYAAVGWSIAFFICRM